MFLLIVCSCTTICSDKFGQAIVDTVKFLLPIATRNLPTGVNINPNASIKKISEIGCARHQVDQSIKFSQCFCGVNDIVCDRASYALLASLDCIVQLRRSRNSLNNSTTGIFRATATRSNVSTLGVDLPLNHSDQFFISTPVKSLNSLKVRFKNSLVFVGLLANITVKIVECVGYFTNVTRYVLVKGFIRGDALQTRKHPLAQVFSENLIPRCCRSSQSIHFLPLVQGYAHHEYNKPRGRSPSPNFSVRPHAALGGAVR